MLKQRGFLELRKTCGDIRVILSSGYEEPKVIRRFIDNEPSGFIQKSYTMAKLRAALHRTLR